MSKRLGILVALVTLLARPAVAEPVYSSTHAGAITSVGTGVNTFTTPAGLVIFSNGDVYVYGNSSTHMFRFRADGTTLDTLTFSNPNPGDGTGGTIPTMSNGGLTDMDGNGTDLYGVKSDSYAYRFTISENTLTYATPISTPAGGSNLALNSSGVLTARGSAYFSASTRDFATTTVYLSGLAMNSAGLSPAPASRGLAANDTTVYYLRTSPRNTVTFRAILGTGTSSSFTLPGSWGSAPLGGKSLSLSSGGYLYIHAATAATVQRIHKGLPVANGETMAFVWTFGSSTGTTDLSTAAAMDVGPDGRIYVVTTTGTLNIFMPIAAPSGVSAVTSGTTVNLSWTTNIVDTDTSGATIVRSTVHTPTSVTDGDIVATAQTGTSYADTGLAGLTTYYYAVFNKTLDGFTSAATGIASATTTCDAGEYDNGSGACVPCTAGCNVGEYQTAACSANADLACASCDASCETCAGSSTNCVSCPSGTHLSAGRCLACSECLAGQYQTQACTTTSDTVCSDCATGTFSDVPGSLTCERCAAGTFAADEGSTECIPCDAGRYSDEGANACSVCMAGAYAAGMSNPMCSACAAGSFSASGAEECTLCGVGTFASTGQAECTACMPGSFADIEGTPSCTPCPAGFAALTSGASGCTPCEAGTYASGGAASCTACPEGTYSLGSTASCTTCDCDDDNACTTDTCDATLGCAHEPSCTAIDAGVEDAAVASMDASVDAHVADASVSIDAFIAIDAHVADASEDARAEEIDGSVIVDPMDLGALVDAAQDDAGDASDAGDVHEDAAAGVHAEGGCSAANGTRPSAFGALSVLALLTFVRRRSRRT